MAIEPVVLRPSDISLGELRRIAEGASVSLDPSSRAAVERAQATVDDILKRGETVYGINTGFGLLAKTRIEPARLRDLQRNLILSHAVGTGPLLPRPVVRLILALKAASLARGHSGVRWSVIEALMALLTHDVLPCIPAKGSVGASGDLAPLAHLSAILIGVGEAQVAGRIMPAADALGHAGLSVMELEPKEGLALLNGTQVSTALALAGLFSAEDDFAAAMVTGAMSVDGIRGSDTPFDARIQEVRGQPGQIDAAAAFRRLLKGSQIRESHVDCDRVQDPYSIRCQPQVMGACLDHIRFSADVFHREANAVSDNPLVFPDEGDVLSGGNFHAEPVAMAADVLALAISEVGALAERRIALLIDPAFSELPAFLVSDSGVNSGFMITQVTAAALASENKSRAHPASVDSLPTSANQEDHVSMATFAARRLADMGDNTRGIIAIELLAAAQAIDFHAPLRTSPLLGGLHARLRERVPFYDKDRYFAPDIAAAKDMVSGTDFHALVGDLLPSIRG